MSKCFLYVSQAHFWQQMCFLSSHEANPGSSTIGLSHQRTIPPPDQSDVNINCFCCKKHCQHCSKVCFRVRKEGKKRKDSLDNSFIMFKWKENILMSSQNIYLIINHLPFYFIREGVLSVDLFPSIYVVLIKWWILELFHRKWNKVISIIWEVKFFIAKTWTCLVLDANITDWMILKSAMFSYTSNV